ncbi:hypothetical protein CTI12_AA532460 [Artemisia annua]|uniref:Vesicle transport v-SNARE N-terminal domain-containing protein n=1 Tax=Artemisia annua TaxID=35608 RepID=A0A2U1L482_ARTAN|nr:hypothetical protein CTI12_AA532460 [Artemisia annua]
MTGAFKRNCEIFTNKTRITVLLTQGEKVRVMCNRRKIDEVEGWYEEKKVRVCEIAGEIDEVEGLIRKMELEAKSLTNDVKAKVVVKLGEYGNDVKKLKAEFAKLRS